MNRREDEGLEAINDELGITQGNFVSDEPMTGHGRPGVQEGASDFYEALGGIIEGKDADDLHTPDLTTDDGPRQ